MEGHRGVEALRISGVILEDLGTELLFFSALADAQAGLESHDAGELSGFVMQ